MSYLVLARKWRPQSFASLVGQQHVLQALINALNQQRLHHAYLFTGTRGVGKTTVARILAKCLNCEAGISATPCDTCSSCVNIDSGRSVDLLEIDAASRTKVEDTRDILQNVPYAPAQSRFKIYLIDEVHMLSGHSFNALLKTLEEPPEHVKFLLATTDPQKLPATVLSRCLQFHLKNLQPEQISDYLATVLNSEKITAETAALRQIALAARGSMRDALSITDQAIAYSDGRITETAIQQMLGTVAHEQLTHLLRAIAGRDTALMLQVAADIVESGADVDNTLASLLQLLHLLAMAHAVPNTVHHYPEFTDLLNELLTRITAADTQLFYEIALLGRRDLPLAPSPQMGLEMTLLRMMVFQPAPATPLPQKSVTAAPASNPAPKPIALVVAAAPVITPAATNNSAIDISDWAATVPQLKLSGVSLALAQNTTLAEQSAQQIHLHVAPDHASLITDNAKERLQQALAKHLGRNTKLQITITRSEHSSPAQLSKAKHAEQHQQAAQQLAADPALHTIIERFDAILAPENIEVIN